MAIAAGPSATGTSLHTGSSSHNRPVKNVVVIGASYAGTHAAELLAAGLPDSHRVILIDKNSHFNHVYRFVRFGVVSGHEAKGFIPYTNILTKHLPPPTASTSSRSSTSSPAYSDSDASEPPSPTLSRDIFINAAVVSVTPDYVEVDRAMCHSDGLTRHCLVDPFERVHEHPHAHEHSRRRVPRQKPPVEETVEQERDCSLTSPSVPKPQSPRRPLYRNASLESIASTGTTAGSGNESAIGPLGQDEKELEAAFESLWQDDQEDVSSLEEQWGRKTTKIRYDYIVFATGSLMPRPLLIHTRTKQEGIQFLKDQQKVIAEASSILIVGGGALGIQYATDIADLYNGAHASQTSSQSRKQVKKVQPSTPNQPSPCNPQHGVSAESTAKIPKKKVTLIHSRDRLLPTFEPGVSAIALRRLEELGVEVILGDRVILPDGPADKCKGKELQHRVLQTKGGRSIETDLQLFCTGQKPNTELVRSLIPSAVGEDGYVRVRRSMQISAGDEEKLQTDKMFAVGDCCHAFGAIKAGHTGWFQAAVAARNILTMIKHEKRRSRRMKKDERRRNEVTHHGGSLVDEESDEEYEESPSDTGSESSTDNEQIRRRSHPHPQFQHPSLLKPVELEEYRPGPPMISLSVGLRDSIKQLMGKDGKLEVSEHKDEQVDSHWEAQWRVLGVAADDVLI